MQIMMAVAVRKRVPDVSDSVPAAETVRRCFAFDPKARPTASELADAFGPHAGESFSCEVHRAPVATVGDGPAAAVGLCDGAHAMLAEARYAEALELLLRARRSMAGGHAKGLCVPIARLYFEGRPGVPKNERSAYEHATQGGAGGCADCLGTQARCLRAGAGCEKSLAQAIVFARSSAASGSVTGQRVLGWMYLNGEGMAKDAAEAARLYRLAADQGYAAAQSNLGHMY